MNPPPNFDLQWLIDAADTPTKKAQAALVLAVASIGELIGKTEGHVERVVYYRDIVRRWDETHGT